MLNKFKKAQATAEYAILFAVVIGAAMGVQAYVKRALQARIHDAADQFIDATSPDGVRNYQWEGVTGTKTTTDQSSRREFVENVEADTQYTYNETMQANYSSNMSR